MNLYVSDAELPEPRPIDFIRNDPGIVEDLSEGAFLLAVPLIENDAQVVRANITVEAGMLRAIDDAAKARGLSRSAFLVQAARQRLNGEK